MDPKLTMDTVASYSKGCSDLHDFLGVLREDCGLLVIPSGGASPFVDGAFIGRCFTRSFCWIAAITAA